MPRLKTFSTLPLLLVLLLLLVGTSVGCQSVRVSDPVDPTFLASQSDDDQMTFWHDLASRSLVANDEAFHALLLFVDGHDDSETYEERVATLKGRKMLPGGFNAQADHAITRGNMAVAIVGALNIKGGVMLRLTGANPRYALRELAYEGLFPQSSSHQTFTGQQFLGIIGKAEDYQREHPAKNNAQNIASNEETPVTPATPVAPE